jgi:NADPH-dependent curcumin reductase CurA
MSGLVNRQYLLKERPRGRPVPACYEWREGPAGAPADGELLVRNLYLSLDPAIRGWMDDAPSYMPPIPVGSVMRGTTIARVVESRCDGFRAGDIVQGLNGWEDYSITPGAGFTAKVPLELHRPLTNFLSVLGPTGLTAYFGLLEVGRPRRGETVLVSGAAGAVGCIAGQIAAILGCRVAGIAGGAEKCRWITEQLGFDAAIDYKRETDLRAAIHAACPGGVDVYFDNVGGPLLECVLANINEHARLLMCGAISGYNAVEPPPGPRNLWQLIVKSARLEGFLIKSYLGRWAEGRAQMAAWLDAGLIKHREHVDRGLENAPQSFLRLFDGNHDGKLIVDIAGNEAA